MRRVTRTLAVQGCAPPSCDACPRHARLNAARVHALLAAALVHLASGARFGLVATQPNSPKLPPQQIRLRLRWTTSTSTWRCLLRPTSTSMCWHGGRRATTTRRPTRQAAAPRACRTWPRWRGSCQFLGRPATSAGVERMFSKAGKLHDDMKKGQQDDTLEHSLFAAANTE